MKILFNRIVILAGVMEVYWHLGWNKRMLHVRELPEESQP